MRTTTFITIVITLLFSGSVQANIVGLSTGGNSITWTNNGGWFQVQDSSTYATVCEGTISTCVTGAGVFNVIDHSNNVRSDNVAVGSSSPIITLTAGLQIVDKTCVKPNGQLSLDYRCAVECPAGKTPVGIRTCTAEWHGPSRSGLHEHIQTLTDGQVACCHVPLIENRQDELQYDLTVRISVACL